MSQTSCKGGCGCAFGKNKKSAFGAGANAFFVPQYTSYSGIQNVSSCLKAGGYANATPSMRFGSKKGGPMKIGKGKK